MYRRILKSPQKHTVERGRADVDEREKYLNFIHTLVF
jgi:hypothetical protein